MGVITTLETHPNRAEIVSTIRSIPRLSGTQLAELARAWRNDAVISQARSDALAVDSPLILEVLEVFDDISAMMHAAVDGDMLFVTDEGTLEEEQIIIAFKAVRDAIAAVYARPNLSSTSYEALLRPWREALAHA